MPPEPMDKPTERAPYLSLNELAHICSSVQRDRWVESVREWYESRITSGELIPRSALDGCVVLPNVKTDSIRTTYGEVWQKVKP